MSIMARIARFLNLYTMADMKGLEQRFVSDADATRQEHEGLRLALNEYEAKIGDIKMVREDIASLPPDAPPLMLKYAIKRQDQILGSMITGVEERQRKRARALARPRDAAGRFLVGGGRNE